MRTWALARASGGLRADGVRIMAGAAEVAGAGMNGKKRRQKADRDGGRFVAVPAAVIDSPGYRAASGNAVKLLLELAAQFKGRNNGDLAMPWKLAKSKGWTSKDVLYRAKLDLLKKGLIAETRKGSRPHKATLYAVTWQGLDDCGGKLDMSPVAFAKFRGAYAQFDSHGRTFGAPPDGPQSPAGRAITDAAKSPEPRQTGHTRLKSLIQSPARRAPSKKLPGGTPLLPGTVVSSGAIALPSARIVIAMLAAGWGRHASLTEPNRQPDTPDAHPVELVYERDAEPVPDYDESQDVA